MISKIVVFGLAALALAGCVTAKNTLSVEDVAGMRYSGAEVSFAPNVRIWWGDGERAYAASKGRPATDSEELAKTPEAQAYLRNTIASKVKVAMDQNLAGALNGSRPVKVIVLVKSVNIPSAIQRVLVGGHHAMTADVTVVDARTGALLLRYDAQTAQALAGQGIAGAIIDSAVAGDPVDRVTVSFAGQYRDWLVRREGNVALAQ